MKNAFIIVLFVSILLSGFDSKSQKSNRNIMFYNRIVQAKLQEIKTNNFESVGKCKEVDCNPREVLQRIQIASFAPTNHQTISNRGRATNKSNEGIEKKNSII